MRIPMIWILSIWAGVAILPAQKGVRCSVSTSEGNGYAAVMFSLPSGTVQAVFPALMVSGERTSSALIVEPFGLTDREREENREMLAGFNMETDGKLVALRDGNIMTLAARRDDQVSRLLVVKTANGGELCQKSIPVKLQISPMKNGEGDYDTFPVVDNRQYLQVWGLFDGDLAHTKIEIDGKPATPLAESSGELVAKSPDGSVGLVKIRITDGKITAEKVIRYVGLDLRDPSQEELRKDRRLRGAAFVHVSGLQALAEPLNLVFENRWWAAGVFRPHTLNPFSSSRYIRSEFQRIDPTDVKTDGTYSTLFRPKHGKTDELKMSLVPVLAILRVRSVVQQAMAAWSTENGIAIAAEAQALIVKGFEERENWLKEVLAEPRTYQWMPNTLLAAVVRQYLYELRDRIGARTAPPPPLAFRFLAGEERTQGIIATLQVLQHSVADYLRTIASRLSGEVVSYKIFSTPQSLHVLVDGEYKGLTNTELILSPGRYMVVIQPPRGKPLCATKIPIVPGPPGELRCPDQN